jgi:hypothetical protein
MEEISVKDSCLPLLARADEVTPIWLAAAREPLTPLLRNQLILSDKC